MFASLYLRERKLPKPTKKEFLWIILLSLVGVVMFNALLFTSFEDDHRGSQLGHAGLSLPPS